MKEGFDGSPIGVRITRRDQELMSKLTTTMYPGLFLSMSDVARVLIREGMRAYGVLPSDHADDPIEPVRRKTAASNGKR